MPEVEQKEDQTPVEESVKATNLDAEPDGDDTEDDDEEPFDLERAKRAISKKNREAQGLRRQLKAAEDKASKWDEYQKEKLSAEERLAAEIADAKKAASDAQAELLRTKVQVKRPDLTEAQIKRLVGDSVDELVADAEELFGPAEPKTTKKSSTPNPDEVTGGRDVREEPDEFDPKKIVASIRRR